MFYVLKRRPMPSFYLYQNFLILVKHQKKKRENMRKETYELL